LNSWKIPSEPVIDVFFPENQVFSSQKRGSDNFQSAQYAVIHCAFCPKLIKNTVVYPFFRQTCDLLKFPKNPCIIRIEANIYGYSCNQYRPDGPLSHPASVAA
jgi:hypothetical protein